MLTDPGHLWREISSEGRRHRFVCERCLCTIFVTRRPDGSPVRVTRRLWKAAMIRSCEIEITDNVMLS